MVKTSVTRLAAGAVITAALMVGSLGLTAATAAASCTDPKCISGTPPAQAAINCPPPHPSVATLPRDISDC